MGKSTGPRTPRGKARSSQNAAKHWIKTGRILPDEQEEAAILRRGFTEDFNPEGLIENEVIDDLTLNRLIRRRIDLAFTREFSRASIEKAIRLQENDERSSTQYWLRAAGVRGRYPGGLEQAERLLPDLCVVALEGIKRRIAERGPQPNDLAELRLIYGDQPTEHAALAMYELIPVAGEKAVQGERPETPEEKQRKESILETLQIEIEVQKNRYELAGEMSAIESASDLQEPARPALDTLLRYRAANAKEFRDLLDSLERIRRLRRSAA